MKKIAVAASLAFDHIMDFPSSFEENIMPDKLKTLSLSFLVDNFNKNFGGVGGNIVYNMGLLKQSTLLFACAGKKDFHQYGKHLKKIGVDISSVNLIKDEFTANMFMLTDKNSCQIAGFYPGAMTCDTDLSEKTFEVNQSADFLVVGPTMPEAMHNFIKQAKKKNLPYLYDPAQGIPRISEDDLKEDIEGAEILIGNDYEMALIEKKTGLTKKQILKKVKVLVTTLGEKGSVIESAGKKIHVGIVKPDKVVDPTGAGDAYIAGFLTGFINGFNLRTCGKMGAVLATYAIEKYGTQKHIFTVRQFKKRFEKEFGENLLLSF